MKKFLLAGIISCFSYVFAHSQCPVIPSPVHYETNDFGHVYETEISIDFETIPPEIQNYLKEQLKAKFDINCLQDRKHARIFFKKTSHEKTHYYKIDALDGDRVTIHYTSPESCFYVVNSLLQLLEKSEEYIILGACLLEDYPKFEWRGLHLDVSRHFFTVDEVKRFIDLMAIYKFNTFHWHLTDDQGWRIEIKKYPKLTEIGAWRDSTVNKHYSTKPRTYTKQRYGGFYTQEEIKEVVRYAQAKFITIVPEIEMPGHSRAALAAYPEFSCTGLQQEVPGLWGIFDDIYCSKAESIQFMQDILSEVLTLFPSEYIHIGGDEAPKERWKHCDKCQAVMQQNGLKDEHELQSYFIRQMDAFLTKQGRKLIGWDEILEGGLSPNATVMSWRGFEGGIEAVKQGHPVVMSPGSHCYFDHYQSNYANEPLAIGGFTTLEKVYSFNPIPPGLTAEQSKLILGGQANLWTEYIPDMKQLEYMTYPRALALAQALWCVNKPEYETFLVQLKSQQLPFLKTLGVHYSMASFYPVLKISKTETGIQTSILTPLASVSEFTESFARKELINNPQVWEFEWDPTATPLKKSQPSIEDLKILKSLPVFNYKLQLHSALGLPIEFTTQPNSRYSNNKELALVDGIIGRRPWNGKEWLGFDTSVIEFTVDLTQLVTVKSLSLSFLEDQSSWIHLPTEIEIYTSTDKQNWTEFKSAKISELSQIELSGKAQFITVKIKTLKQIPAGLPGEGKQAWTFLDELFVDYAPE